MTLPIRIAMWSGPRNISTAMMRAFENRADSWVLDEPFYAYYLATSGLDHPMRAEIVAHGETDPRQVMEQCRGEEVRSLTVQYQKHMCHHMLPSTALDWLADVHNCFLIRHPREVAASYAAKRKQLTADDLGFRRQADLFDLATSAYRQPAIVLDARDVLNNPRRMMGALCAHLEIPFDEDMLAWPAGKRQSDGIWSDHWYGAVEASTGFAAPGPPADTLTPELEDIVNDCLPFYEKLAHWKLKP